ncbi:MAG: 6-phosphogluconolactonase [Gammaproteobacteria bacterium]|nr:6-phosphogluconolactonase [Gammaproteobacteria bacterium]MDH5802292.1 6-phosphogluconolactonase [Gammaproteobacteria bacterium]
MGKVFVHQSVDQLNEAVARHWLELCRQAVADHDGFYVSLAGGSTPQKLYHLLSTPPFAEEIHWQKVHLFFGDERCVPKDHADSNYRMAKDAFIGSVPIPPANVHAVDIVEGDPQGSALGYAAALDVLPKNSKGLPQFDLMLLGMGDDGHTASLFPGTELLQETQQWAGAVYVKKLNAWRVSLTFPVINAAHNIVFLIAGEAKAAVLGQLFQAESASRPAYPVEQVLHGAEHELQWRLDESAAAELPDSLLTKR